MVLFIIGLGLGDEKDITLKGLEAVKSCKKVYLETYTSILGVDSKKLSDFYGIQVEEADRECCESGIDQILENIAQDDPDSKYAFLVVGGIDKN
jgi:diphthine synthase